MANRSPAFQFYPADWLSSARVRCMTPEQKGAYIDLLAYQWLDPDCSLPDDDSELAVLSGLGEVGWKGSSSTLRGCFKYRSSSPPRIANERLRCELQKQAEWRERCANGGVKSGVTRRRPNDKKREVPLKGSSSTLEGGMNTPSSVCSSQSPSNNRTTAMPIPFSDNPAFAAAWATWETFRAELKPKGKYALTPTTRSAQLARCQREGPGKSIAVIRKSIEQGWRGLFWEGTKEATPDTPKVVREVWDVPPPEVPT